MSKCTPVVNKCQRRIYIGTRACPSSQIDWDLMVIHSCQNVRGRDRKMGKHIIHHTLRISRRATQEMRLLSLIPRQFTILGTTPFHSLHVHGGWVLQAPGFI